MKIGAIGRFATSLWPARFNFLFDNYIFGYFFTSKIKVVDRLAIESSSSISRQHSLLQEVPAPIQWSFVKMNLDEPLNISDNQGSPLNNGELDRFLIQHRKRVSNKERISDNSSDVFKDVPRFQTDSFQQKLNALSSKVNCYDGIRRKSVLVLKAIASLLTANALYRAASTNPVLYSTIAAIQISAFVWDHYLSKGKDKNNGYKFSVMTLGFFASVTGIGNAQSLLLKFTAGGVCNLLSTSILGSSVGSSIMSVANNRIINPIIALGVLYGYTKAKNSAVDKIVENSDGIKKFCDSGFKSFITKKLIKATDLRDDLEINTSIKSRFANYIYTVIDSGKEKVAINIHNKIMVRAFEFIGNLENRCLYYKSDINLASFLNSVGSTAINMFVDPIKEIKCLITNKQEIKDLGITVDDIAGTRNQRVVVTLVG